MNRPQFTDTWICFGLASAPVHKVIKRWTPIIGPAWIELGAPRIAKGVRTNKPFGVFAITRMQRAFFAELILALDAWRERKNEVELARCLNMGHHTGYGKFDLRAAPLDSFKELAGLSEMKESAVKKAVGKWRANYAWFSAQLAASRLARAKGDADEKEALAPYASAVSDPPIQAKAAPRKAKESARRIVPRKRKKSVR